MDPHERAVLDRHAAALRDEEVVGGVDPDAEAAVRASLDSWRAEHGVPPLVEWWELKTEPELHHRARALGLLD